MGTGAILQQTRQGLLLIGLFFTVLAVTVDAQDPLAQDPFRFYKHYDRYRYIPRFPSSGPAPPPLPDVEEPVEGSTDVLVDELKGLVFVDHPDKVQEGTLETTGIRIDSHDRLQLLRTQTFHRIASAYLGGPISLRRLNQLSRDIILLYRRNDLPVVDVSIPEQDITDGVVQVVVTEARIGEIVVQGSCYFDACVLADQLFLCPGEPIYESRLMTELEWLYRNPFRTVDLELTPGAERGQTDVVFNVDDRLPLRGYVGYEDTGTRLTDLERVFAGVNWYNAFNNDDQMGYQYTTNGHFDNLQAHSAFYSHALENRDLFTVFASWADFQAPIPGFGTNEGEAWQILLRYNIELARTCRYQHGLTLGFDFKRTNSSLDFGPVPVFGSTVDIQQFLLGYQGILQDEFGLWSLAADLYWSPGNFFNDKRNTSRNFRTLRAFASADYVYSRAIIERRLQFCGGSEIVGRVTGQLASGNLIQSEQLGFGGYNSVRGYDQYSVIGDSGYFATAEYWTPIVSPGLICGDELRGLAFYDFGNSLNHTLLPGEDDNVDLQSFGFGMRYALKPHIQLRADFAWQLIDLEIPNTTDNSRVHIGLVVSEEETDELLLQRIAEARRRRRY